jgi:hypothetical protein
MSEKGLALTNGQIAQKEMFENLSIKLPQYEVKVYNAIMSKKIRDYDADSLLRGLTDLMMNVIKDSGIKGTQAPDYILRICDIMLTYYGHLTLNEIKMAFELSFIGKLNEYLPKDKFGQPDNNHYQALSVDYIGKIVNAYLRYKSAFLLKMKDHMKEPLALPEKVDYRTLMIERFEYYKQNHELPVMVYGRVAEYLKQFGLKIVTDMEVINSYKRLEQLKKQAAGDFSSFKDQFQGYMEMISDVTIAEVSIKEYFDELIKAKKELSELIPKP